MDQLNVNDILPAYFQDNRKNNSEIWGKDLSFQRGEMIKIVAPSGRGKTSLIHFLYGLRKDYNGSIQYGKNNMGSYASQLTRKERWQMVQYIRTLQPKATAGETPAAPTATAADSTATASTK